MTAEILRGGAEKAREAGVVIAGGHTVKDREPKYGLVVLGFVDPRRMLSKGGLRVGDRLVLTKPLGFGLTTTALKRDQVDQRDLAEAVSWMTRLNRTAGQLALDLELVAGTDVTGFGLLGHGSEMASAADVALELDFGRIPLLSGAHKYAVMECFAGGLLDNRAYFGSRVQFGSGVDEASQAILFDPQTSGGLLLGVPDEKMGALSARALQLGQEVWTIGEVKSGKGIRVK
jgi:selenide,water dikinase